jgi:hypothetical protein
MSLKFIKKTILLLALILLLLPISKEVSAQATQTVPDYAVLVPLPGTTFNCNVMNAQGVPVPTECSNLETYLPNAFNLTMVLLWH